MSKHVVIQDFKDLQDNEHIYRKGDKFPHAGRVKKERIEELSTENNKIGMPVIQEVGE